MNPLEALESTFDADMELAAIEAELAEVQMAEAKRLERQEMADLVSRVLGISVKADHPKLQILHESLLARGIEKGMSPVFNQAIRSEVHRATRQSGNLDHIAAFLEKTADMIRQCS